MEKCCKAREATDANIIWRMHFACWITKATNPHSEYVILTAFPRQQWLLYRASVLGYMYIACLVLCHHVYAGSEGNHQTPNLICATESFSGCRAAGA